MNLKRGGLMLAGLVLVLAVASGAWAASEKVLYAFHGNDGWAPTSVILGADGALYGTTMNGGTNCGQSDDCGVVFQLTRGSDGKWSETVLHDFGGSDGWFPNGSLVADKAGNLYGTTVYGGSKGCSNLGCGLVFELVRGRGDKWTYKVLYNFGSGGGLWPYAGMIFDSNGNLYGTTSGGGNFNACEGGCGVVFELSPDRKGNWTETVLHSFGGGDGNGPRAPLTLDAAGSLYGTTQFGGVQGTGTVFELTLGKGGKWTEQLLYSFGGYDTKDGDQPLYGVTFDARGDLFGTTQFGGMVGQQGWGTAFRLTPAGGGKWKETILHAFDRAGRGGGYLGSGLILDDAGNLYGTTLEGGRLGCPGSGGGGCGVVFRLAPCENGRWAEVVLHAFGVRDGSHPGGGLAFDSSGNLIGVTDQGGYVGGVCAGKYNPGCGVVFEVTP
jgi:uncharacterized repeat protein (TIGR03803 family)